MGARYKLTEANNADNNFITGSQEIPMNQRPGMPGYQNEMEGSDNMKPGMNYNNKQNMHGMTSTTGDITTPFLYEIDSK